MKKYFLFAIALLTFVSCGNTKTEEALEGGDFGMEITNQHEEDENKIIIENPIYERVAETPAFPLQLTPLKQGEELAVLHTNYGDITLRFFPEEAPLAVENYLTHMKNGLYDGLIFHRVMPGFMIQGGSPDGTSASNFHYSIAGEFRSNGFAQNNIRHVPGVLSMARTGDPNSASVQFFIMHGASPGLDGDYAAFGMVISGLEVVDQIVRGPRNINAPDPSQRELLITPAVIRSITADTRGVNYPEPVTIPSR
jgi:peptidyl-prolyl cis-trans isomerase B (cyclophilin B)